MSTDKQSTNVKDAPLLGAVTCEGIVIIQVGPEGRKYQVHKALLKHHSEYFAKALTGSWKEAEEGLVVLDDVEPGVFNIFVTWLYTGTLPERSEDWLAVIEAKDPNPPDEVAEHLAKLKAYTFGDRMLAFEFRRAVNSSFVDSLKARVVSRDIYVLAAWAFNNIPAECAILQLLVDDHCRLWDHTEDDYNDYARQRTAPAAFLLRVMRRFSEISHLRDSDLPLGEEYEDRCYYEHATAEEEKGCTKKHMDYDADADYGWFN